MTGGGGEVASLATGVPANLRMIFIVDECTEILSRKKGSSRVGKGAGNGGERCD